MEPERKIEKLLRAYAKKRRADAGDPLTLHPATRRLLLGEVARRKPKPENEEETSVSLWEFFRQRWALLAGFALVIFFGAALFLPTLSGAKKKAQSVTAMNNLTQIGVAAQMAAGENAGRLPASLARSRQDGDGPGRQLLLHQHGVRRRLPDVAGLQAGHLRVR